MSVPRLRIVLVSMVVVVVAAACGGDDASGGGTSASSTVATAATTGTEGEWRVSVAFWQTSRLDVTSGAPAVPTDESPRITLDFTWDDPAECFVWERTVAAAAGGGTRVNAATDFEVSRDGDVWVFTYRQNASRCGDFGTDGTVKTYRSDVLTQDPSTGQTGDPLWGAVADVAIP